MADALTPSRMIRERGRGTAAGVPTVGPMAGERVQPAGVAQMAGLRAMGSVLERMSGQAGALFDREFEKEATRVGEEASLAGQQHGLDADLPDLRNLPMGDTIAERAFRDAALLSGRLNVEMQIRDSVSRLETENEGQPQRFEELVAGDAKGFVGKLPVELRGVAQETYQRLAMASKGRLQHQQRQHEIDVLQADLIRNTEGLIVSTAQEARRGDYGNAMASLAVLGETLAASGPVAAGGTGVMTATQIEQALQKAQGTIRTEYMMGYLDRAGKNRRSLNALVAGETSDPIANEVMKAMMPAEKDRLVSALEADVKRAEAEWQARERERMAREQMSLRSQLQDEEMRLRMGLPSVAPISPEQVASAYGAEDGAKVYDSIATALTQAATIGQVGQMTLDEQEAMLGAALPDPASDGYAEAMKLHQERVAAVRGEREALMADPAGYVAARDGGVSAAWQAAQEGDPLAYQAAVDVTLAEQERRGVPEHLRQPLPAAVVSERVDSFVRAGDPRERLAIVEQLAGVTDPAVRRQIVSNFERQRGDGGNLPAGAMARVADIAAADPNRAAKALDYLMVPNTNLNLPAMTGTAFKGSLDTVATSGVQGIRAKQQGLTGLGSIAAVTARDMAMIEHVGKAMVQGGVDPARAPQEAADLLFGDLETFDDTGMFGSGLGTLILPAGTPKNVLEAGLRMGRDQVADALAPVDDGPLSARQMQDYRDQVRARGIWVNSGADLALIDSATGEPFNVELSRLTLDDVLDLGDAQLAERDAAWQASPIGRAVTGANQAMKAVGEDETLRAIIQGGARAIGTLGDSLSDIPLPGSLP